MKTKMTVTKQMYEQWRHVKIMDFAFAFLIIAILVIASIIIFFKLKKAYNHHDEFEIRTVYSKEDFLNWLINEHTGTIFTLGVCIFLAIVILIAVLFALRNFLMEPKVLFFQYIFGKNR